MSFGAGVGELKERRARQAACFLVAALQALPPAEGAVALLGPAAVGAPAEPLTRTHRAATAPATQTSSPDHPEEGWRACEPPHSFPGKAGPRPCPPPPPPRRVCCPRPADRCLSETGAVAVRESQARA